MPRIRPPIFIPLILTALAAAIMLWPTPVSAQCGSQASSCKNCHEVQGQDPVNDKGDWHIQHAFGDFCEFCHVGNVTATDKNVAHQGMISPLSDVKGSCQQCHAADLTEKAQIYATALGIDLSSSGEGAAEAAPTSTPVGGSPAPSADIAISRPIGNELVVDDPNVTDYVQRYNEIVLGQHPVNWGNIILGVMIGLIVVGGGGFVILNEKLISVSFGDTHKVEKEYPTEVVDMLPAITGLKSRARKSLKSILDNSTKTEKVLDLIDEVVSDEGPEE